MQKTQIVKFQTAQGNDINTLNTNVENESLSSIKSATC